MMRDPYYRAIVEGLNSKLDPDLFELCVADILREVYPTLVPICGGQDAGMDGAIADGEGEPYPLVTTTGKDVIGNLTKNLNRYVKEGGLRKKVVLATSQSLTPRRIQNLYKRARELGFTLVNVHEQTDIAGRLYRHPKWVKDLLGISGNAPALSIFPKSDRPIINKNLIARDADLQWLQKTTDDVLLVGEPGSGKTFLLCEFVKQNEGLFVVSNERDEIANGIRSQQPRYLIVDDAALHIELVWDLRQMRQELGAEFIIITSGWPGNKDKLAYALSLPESQIRNLELLTRDEIVEVIKDAGLQGPRGLIKEIVDQSEGRPGLAATLADLCLKGSTREVILGDAISRSIKSYFLPRVGEKAIDVLAAFSVGGDAGMSLQVVADWLKISPLEVRTIAVELAAGGVVWEVKDDYYRWDQGTRDTVRRLAVHPAILRHVFLREVFFSGAFSLSIDTLLEHVPDRESAAVALIGAYSRGADVDEAFLLRFLEQVNSVSVWINYAWLGPKEAEYVFTKHPEHLPYRPALHHIPSLVLPGLFQLAIDDDRAIHSTPEHPLRLISDWVKSAIPGTKEVVNRRKVLLDSVIQWVLRGGDIHVFSRVLAIVFSPDFENTSADPGSGNSLTIQYGPLSLNEMKEIRRWWKQTVDHIKQLDDVDWHDLKELVRSWAYSSMISKHLSPEQKKFMKEFASEILSDLVAVFPDSPGLARWANQIAVHIDIPLRFSVPEEFLIIYPVLNKGERWSDVGGAHKQDVRHLAKQWALDEPHEVASRIIWMKKECEDVNWPDLMLVLCEEIAQSTERPSLWIEEFLVQGQFLYLTRPFLKRMIEIGEPGWEKTLHSYLKNEDLEWSVAWLILEQNPKREELIEGAIKTIINTPGFGANYDLPSGLSEDIILRLLTYGHPILAEATAKSMWYTSSSEEKERLFSLIDWRKAVLNATDDHFLADVIAKNADLAFDWLVAIFDKKKDDIFFSFHRFDLSLKIAAGVLNREQKIRIIKILAEKGGYESFVYWLVENDIGLYDLLLESQELQPFHLVPIGCFEQDIENWIRKMLIALDAGYGPEDVMIASLRSYCDEVSVWPGPISNRWKLWMERFEKLLTYDDDLIREIGRLGKKKSELEYQEASTRERKRAIYGID